MTLEDLLGCGFVRVARWQRDPAGTAIVEGEVPSGPGLYLFSVQQHVQYVGSALDSLRKRMNSYQRRQRNRNSSRPVHVELATAVSRGDEVTIHVRPIARGERGTWNGLPVNLALGIEAALIADMNPPWNKRGRTLLLDHDSAGSDEEGAA